MEDLDIAIHSWDINPEHIEICKRPSGRPWMLGSGAPGFHGISVMCTAVCNRNPLISAGTRQQVEVP